MNLSHANLGKFDAEASLCWRIKEKTNPWIPIHIPGKSVPKHQCCAAESAVRGIPSKRYAVNGTRQGGSNTACSAYDYFSLLK